MNRIYAADGHLIHDPATGLTHQAPQPHSRGRLRLAEELVNVWPAVPPADLDRPFPVSLCWSPIVRCNLRCPHCLDDTSVPQTGSADHARIADLLAESGVLGVDISGGEPLLLRRLPNLARRIAEGGRAAVSVTTNGWHLQRRAGELVGAVDAIRVSLDGPDQASHDHVRGEGSFTRAMQGIRTALEEGMAVQVQTVLMAGNQAHAQQMVDLAAALGVGGVTFLQMLPIGAGSMLRQQMLTDPDALTLLDRVRVPGGLRVRLRTRAAAGGFTVVRADGRVWRNNHNGQHIGGLRPLTTAADLMVTGRDGSA